jgi:coenzyme F420-reducing hydrogenase beta subunit
MTEDHEGFLYPKVDESTCVDCGLCNQVCPIQNVFSPTPLIEVFAAYNKNEEIRRESSSGGVYTLLAEKVIDEGGVVFGAAFDDQWQVILDFSESKQGLSRFRSSKYVQADVRETFRQCERFLKAGRSVLFSGTPCQIAGLRRYLGKDYEHLLTVDVICHGVPSPKVWRKYLYEVRRNTAKKTAVRRLLEKVPFCSSLNPLPLIKSIRFRDKSDGWKKFRFVLELAEASAEGKQSSVLSSIKTIDEPFYENVYMKAFLQNLDLRPSCHHCRAKSGMSNSDLTIADFWGIQNVASQMDDDKGTNLILVNTVKGEKYLDSSKTIYTEVEVTEALRDNPAWHDSVGPHCKREQFFKQLEKSNNLIKLIGRELNPSVNLFHNVKARCRRVYYCIRANH